MDFHMKKKSQFWAHKTSSSALFGSKDTGNSAISAGMPHFSAISRQFSPFSAISASFSAIFASFSVDFASFLLFWGAFSHFSAVFIMQTAMSHSRSAAEMSGF
jgi:hypothetical protein